VAHGGKNRMPIRATRKSEPMLAAHDRKAPTLSSFLPVSRIAAASIHRYPARVGGGLIRKAGSRWYSAAMFLRPAVPSCSRVFARRV